MGRAPSSKELCCWHRMQIADPGIQHSIANKSTAETSIRSRSSAHIGLVCRLFGPDNRDGGGCSAHDRTRVLPCGGGKYCLSDKVIVETSFWHSINRSRVVLLHCWNPRCRNARAERKPRSITRIPRQRNDRALAVCWQRMQHLRDTGVLFPQASTERSGT